MITAGWAASPRRSPRMIHAYPGMGATAAMFGPQWRERIPGVYHDWPKWAGETSIRELAERIVERDQIQDGDQVIGTSLGGIIACEIGKLKELDLVVLIASAERKEEIDRILGLLHPLVDLAPLAFVKACAGRIPLELARMFSESEPVFIRTIVKAIFKWEGAAPDVPIFRIHGTTDRVIPTPLKIDHLINGGHLIVMTNAKECIDRLTENKPEGGNGVEAPGKSDHLSPGPSRRRSRKKGMKK